MHLRAYRCGPVGSPRCGEDGDGPVVRGDLHGVRAVGAADHGHVDIALDAEFVGHLAERLLNRQPCRREQFVVDVGHGGSYGERGGRGQEKAHEVAE
jgi:hypothetical protein